MADDLDFDEEPPTFDDEGPTIVSKPKAGAGRASSAAGSLDDEPPGRHSDSWTTFDDQVPTKVSRPDGKPGGNWSGGTMQDDDTFVQPKGTQMEHVAFLYCRKGLRKGQLYQFRQERSAFGRGPDCDFQIEDKSVSAHHGSIRLRDGAWSVFDFDSENGTYVNGQKLGEGVANPIPLKDGDIIQVGDTELVFKTI